MPLWSEKNGPQVRTYAGEKKKSVACISPTHGLTLTYGFLLMEAKVEEKMRREQMVCYERTCYGGECSKMKCFIKKAKFSF